MSQGKLKKLAAASIAAIALSYSFNSVAEGDVDNTPLDPALDPMVTVEPDAAGAPGANDGANDNDHDSKNQPAPVSYDHDMTMRLHDQLKALDDYLAANRRNSDPEFDHLTDPVASQMLDLVQRAVENGADPNYVDPDSNIAVFGWALWMSYELKRPDVVETFLNHGADARMKMTGPLALPTIQNRARQNMHFPIPRNENRHLTPMDHALLAMRHAEYRNLKRVHAALDIIDMLKQHGAEYEDSLTIGRMIESDRDLARNVVALAVLKEKGFISEEDFREIVEGSEEVAEMARNLQGLNEQVLEELEASLSDYPDGVPGGPEPYEVQGHDTLHDIAYRFQNVMEARSTHEALTLLAEKNNINIHNLNSLADPDAPGLVKKGDVILIPQPVDTQLNRITLRGPVTLDILARNAAAVFHRPGFTHEEIKEELVRINGLDREYFLEQNNIMPARMSLWIPLVNDGPTYIQQLVPPRNYDRDRQVHLFLTEPRGPHQKQVFTAAASTAYAVNRDTDFGRLHALNGRVWEAFFTNPERGSPLMRVLHHPDSALKDDVVFSSSFALLDAPMYSPESRLDEMRNARRGSEISSEIARIHKDRAERVRPIIFQATGNDNPSRGSYTHRVADVHSSRSTFVGAVGTYPAYRFPGNRAEKVISAYSSYGSTICGVLPPNMGAQMEGTSFSAPATAALYRQFSEWYGDELAFEEIMAAGLMSADRDLLEYEDGEKVDQIMKGRAPFNIEDFAVRPASYQVNAAGLPVNEMCGAGVLNPYQWNETLKVMLELKQQRNLESDYHSEHVYVGDAVAIEVKRGDNGQPEVEYVYEVEIPHDMTLDQLTFFVAQNRFAHSDVTAVSPGGFSYLLPKSPTDTVTTMAFNYEDVKAGDKMTVRTSQPLAESAGIMLRGHKGSNIVQELRDHLRVRGALATPLTSMEADRPLPPGYDSDEQTVSQDTRLPVNDNAMSLLLRSWLSSHDSITGRPEDRPDETPPTKKPAMVASLRPD